MRWIIATLVLGLFQASGSFAATVESAFSWGQVKMTQAQEQEYHRVAKVVGREWQAILSVEIEGEAILTQYSDLSGFEVSHFEGGPLAIQAEFPVDLRAGRTPRRFQMEFVVSDGTQIVLEDVGWEVVNEEYQVRFETPWTGTQVQIDLISNGVDDRYYGRLTLSSMSSGLTVSGTKAGGWRGRSHQPSVEDWSRVAARFHQINQEVRVKNPTGGLVNGADVEIKYDPAVFSGLAAATDQSDFILVYNDMGSMLKVSMASAYGDNSQEFSLFWLVCTGRPDATLGTTTITARFVFYNEEGRTIGTQTVHWSVDIVEE